MHYNAFLSLALLGSSTAQILSAQSHNARLHPRDINDVNNLPTIKSSLKHGMEGVVGVDNAFKALTETNVKEQLGAVNAALLKLSSEVTADMKKLKASGAIGIGEILGLASEAPRNELISTISGLFSAMNKTAITIGSKREIIKASGAVDTIVPGIKSQREGLVAIISIVPGQVPSIAKGAIDGIINNIMTGAKGGAPPAGGSPAAPPTPPTLRRRQTDGKAKGGAGKGGAGAAKPKGGAGTGGAPKASSGSSSGGITLESLLASPAALESTGKAIDGVLDRIISWLRGTTDTLIPPEMAEAMAKGMAKGPKGAGPPKAGGESGAAPPKADGESGAAAPNK
jgi:hypothetical protein